MDVYFFLPDSATAGLPGTPADSASRHLLKIRRVKAAQQAHSDSSHFVNSALQVVKQKESSADSTAKSKRLTSPSYINLYKGHELKPIHKTDIEITESQPDWLFLVLIFIIALLAYMKVSYTKFISRMTSAVFNNHLTNQIVRDESLLVQRGSIILSVMFNIAAGLLLYIISIHYDWSLGGIGTGFLRFAFMALLVSLAMAVKFVVLKICGYLFNQERETATYIFNIFLINNLLGIILLPLIAIIVFSQIIPFGVGIKIAVALVIIAYLYRLFRGILVGLSYAGFSPFYLFLYLCALEVAPLSVLIKLIAKQ